ncbi:hypothetical protein [Streptomyces malaysiensis]|uniref:hypothetical protein n=1 Tax=Streptomyces malaysiensis TaxID=92644 RepID=UPI0036C4EAA8
MLSTTTLAPKPVFPRAKSSSLQPPCASGSSSVTTAPNAVHQESAGAADAVRELRGERGADQTAEPLRGDQYTDETGRRVEGADEEDGERGEEAPQVKLVSVAAAAQGRIILDGRRTASLP